MGAFYPGQVFAKLNLGRALSRDDEHMQQQIASLIH